MAGYGITLASARRRVFDVVVGYLIGAVVGVVIAMWELGRPMTPQSSVSEEVRRWAVVSILALAPVVALVATWKLHLRRQLNNEDGSGGAEHN
jgi:hypothetical protein